MMYVGAGVAAAGVIGLGGYKLLKNLLQKKFSIDAPQDSIKIIWWKTQGKPFYNEGYFEKLHDTYNKFYLFKKGESLFDPLIGRRINRSTDLGLLNGVL